MVFDEKFWVAVAFVTFIIAVWKPIARFITRSLDERSEAIRRELEEAVRLREEAQVALAAYQKKQKESIKEAEGILLKAREEAKSMLANAEDEIRRSLDERRKIALEKITQAESKALQDVQNNIVDIAIGAARLIIQEHLAKGSGQDLIRLAMSDIERKIH